MWVRKKKLLRWQTVFSESHNCLGLLPIMFSLYFCFIGDLQILTRREKAGTTKQGNKEISMYLIQFKLIPISSTNPTPIKRIFNSAWITAIPWIVKESNIIFLSNLLERVLDFKKGWIWGWSYHLARKTGQRRNICEQHEF